MVFRRLAGKLAVQVEGGEVAEADRVVLALGNFPPSGFPIKGRLPAGGPRFVEGAEFVQGPPKSNVPQEAPVCDALDSFDPRRGSPCLVNPPG